MQLQDARADFEAAGLKLVTLSYDPVATLKAFGDNKGLSFPMLSDEGSATIRAMGIENMDGVPHPGTFIIDREGVVRAKLFEEGYKKRHAPSEIIAAAEGL